MIKFFRRIRQQLLSQNKFSKYMLYAIGEIILVVIGILIALNINNRNLVHQKEVKLEAMFESILDELETDIVNVKYVLDYDKQQDSLLTIIINGDLNQSNLDILYSALSFEPLNITDNAFNNLVNNIDEIPKQYQEIYKGLDFLHTRLKPRALSLREKLDSRVYEEFDKWSNTKSWYHEFMIDIREGFNDYALNDPMFKNYAGSLKLILMNKIDVLREFNYQATRSYIEIDNLLHKKNKLPNFISDDFKYISIDELQKYDGLFALEDDPQFKIRITPNNGFIVLRFESNQLGKWHLFPKSNLEFHDKNDPNLKVFFNKSSNGEVLDLKLQNNGKDHIFVLSEE